MDEISLLSVVLTLRPLAAVATSAHLGRAAHAVLLKAIAQHDPALAGRLHDGPSAGSGPTGSGSAGSGQGSGLKPVTASPLIGLKRAEGLRPERTYTLRFTALTAEAAAGLLAAVTPARGGKGRELRELEELGPLGVGAVIDLDGAALRVEAVEPQSGNPNSSQIPEAERTGQAPNQQSAINNPQSAIHPHPWAAQTSYEALAAPWLLGRAQPERKITLQFASPTTFKSGGKNVPVPLPEWVFGSLLEKWNAFAPVALPGEARRFAAECLALSRYELGTRGLPLKDGVKIGAVGQATYTALNNDRYWLSLMNLLADFALYAGVGAGTTMGLGQCRRVG